jgi:protein tyrosine phosphatase
MATEMKKGRESIKNKRYEVLKEIPYQSRNRLELNEKQKDYINANDLEVRFIYKKDYIKNNNFHRTGWKVIADPEFPGANAEGVVEVGDLVLAVKTKESQAYHRKELQRRSDVMGNVKGIQKKAREELESRAKDAKLNVRIHEGYEEDKADAGDDD